MNIKASETEIIEQNIVEIESIEKVKSEFNKIYILVFILILIVVISMYKYYINKKNRQISLQNLRRII